MTHILYGYKVENGEVVIDEKEAKQIKILFEAYLAGLSLQNSAKKAGIERNHGAIGRMLSNKRYLGDHIYPALIGQDVFKQVQKERQRRSVKLGRNNFKRKKRIRPKEWKLTMPEIEVLHSDPFKQAEYVYGQIQSEVV